MADMKKIHDPIREKLITALPLLLVGAVLASFFLLTFAVRTAEEKTVSRNDPSAMMSSVTEALASVASGQFRKMHDGTATAWQFFPMLPVIPLERPVAVRILPDTSFLNYLEEAIPERAGPRAVFVKRV
ncbi:MAG: hypothetical protein PHS41_07345 [Victivallaceae bacterium]|nr:hypothetical protein [Victivallaceae bacterium]